MIVCVCHRVSDRDIARAVAAGCDSFDELQEHCRVGTACGACLECAQDTFAAHGGNCGGECGGGGHHATASGGGRTPVWATA